MNKELITILLQTCRNAISAFDETLKTQPQLHTFEINCNNLNDKFHLNDIRLSVEFKKLFEDVTKITNPVVYWFVIKTNISAQNIVDNLICYREKEGINARSTPAFKKLDMNINSKILYVGKVKNIFWARLITHLGFLKGKGQTQGLQLNSWTRDLNLNLELNVLEFNKEMADYLTIIEVEFAKQMHPILGKHK